jgi:hypothetical protein
VQSYVWMYGYGGSWDMRSEVRGWLDFQWTGSTANELSAYSYCDPHWSTYWFNVGCVNFFNQYNVGWTQQTTRGDFLPGHLPVIVADRPLRISIMRTRSSMIAKGQYGNAYCSGYFTGSIVNNATMMCYFSQPPRCGVGGSCFSSAPHSGGY